MSTILSPPRRTIAPALWDAPVVVYMPRRSAYPDLTLAEALDLDAIPGAVIVACNDGGRVLAVCFADRPGVWQTTDAATVPV